MTGTLRSLARREKVTHQVIVISVDGQTLINYGEDKRTSGVTVWDVYSGKILHTLTKDLVQSLTLSVNEQTIVCTEGRGRYGGDMIFWNLKSDT